MKVACHFPGCQVKGYRKGARDDLSYHMVPVELTARVAQLINLDTSALVNARIMLCSAHFQDGSFILYLQKDGSFKRFLRKDKSFIELLVTTGDEAPASSSTPVTSRKRKEEHLTSEEEDTTPKAAKKPRLEPASGKSTPRKCSQTPRRKSAIKEEQPDSAFTDLLGEIYNSKRAIQSYYNEILACQRVLKIFQEQTTPSGQSSSSIQEDQSIDETVERVSNPRRILAEMRNDQPANVQTSFRAENEPLGHLSIDLVSPRKMSCVQVD